MLVLDEDKRRLLAYIQTRPCQTCCACSGQLRTQVENQLCKQNGTIMDTASVAADSTPAPSRFRCQDHMAAAAGKEGLVQLHFPTTADSVPVKLYAHKSFLRCCSGVLRGLLGDDPATPAGDQPAAKVPKVAADSHPGAAATVADAAGPEDVKPLQLFGCIVPAIPMPDEDPAAWEDMLGIVYPLVPATKVSWDNAERLLLLADKFDCPCITEQVRSFFKSKPQQYLSQHSSELAAGLKAESAFSWLLTFSKCGLDDLAADCISYIKTNIGNALPVGFFSSGLQPKHLEQVCIELQTENGKLRSRLSLALLAQAQRQEPNSAVQPVNPTRYCTNCHTEWYRQPHSKTPTSHCVKCGIAKLRGYRA